jgi:hypothetical protein
MKIGWWPERAVSMIVANWLRASVTLKDSAVLMYKVYRNWLICTAQLSC